MRICVGRFLNTMKYGHCMFTLCRPYGWPRLHVSLLLSLTLFHCSLTM